MNRGAQYDVGISWEKNPARHNLHKSASLFFMQRSNRPYFIIKNIDNERANSFLSFIERIFYEWINYQIN